MYTSKQSYFNCQNVKLNENFKSICCRSHTQLNTYSIVCFCLITVRWQLHRLFIYFDLENRIIISLRYIIYVRRTKIGVDIFSLDMNI